MEQPLYEIEYLEQLDDDSFYQVMTEIFNFPEDTSREELLNAYEGYIAQLNQQKEEKSLYERLGGIYAIAAVVDRFSDALIENTVVGKLSSNPYLRDWSVNKADRLPGLKWLRTLWVADITGGPYKFVATKPGKCPMSLENAHREFQISPAEFDAVAGALAEALDYYEVPAKEKQEVLAAFSAHKVDVNTGFFEARNMPSGVIKCPARR